MSKHLGQRFNPAQTLLRLSSTGSRCGSKLQPCRPSLLPSNTSTSTSPAALSALTSVAEASTTCSVFQHLFGLVLDNADLDQAEDDKPLRVGDGELLANIVELAKQRGVLGGTVSPAGISANIATGALKMGRLVDGRRIAVVHPDYEDEDEKEDQGDGWETCDEEEGDGTDGTSESGNGALTEGGEDDEEDWDVEDTPLFRLLWSEGKGRKHDFGSFLTFPRSGLSY
jgi:hypothetical protein